MAFCCQPAHQNGSTVLRPASWLLCVKVSPDSADDTCSDLQWLWATKAFCLLRPQLQHWSSGVRKPPISTMSLCQMQSPLCHSQTSLQNPCTGCLKKTQNKLRGFIQPKFAFVCNPSWHYLCREAKEAKKEPRVDSSGRSETLTQRPPPFFLKKKNTCKTSLQEDMRIKGPTFFFAHLGIPFRFFFAFKTSSCCRLPRLQHRKAHLLRPGAHHLIDGLPGHLLAPWAHGG